MRNNRFSTLFFHSNHQSDRAMNDAKRKKPNDKRNAKKNTHLQNNDHVVFLSIDYDGCGACLTKLSETVAAEVLNVLRLRKQDFVIDSYQANFNSRLKRASDEAKQREAFLEHLRKDIAAAKDVRLMIGSNRQDKDIDLLNAVKHGSGLVMTEFPKLAKEQEWKYDNFLHQEFDELKVNLLKSQINYVASTLKQGQYATIHFYDDRDDILRELIKNIEPEDMPENVRLNLTKVL